MKRLGLAIAFLMCLSQASLPEDVDDPALQQLRISVLQHLRVMTSETESWEVRCEAEDALQHYPAEPVLRGLLPHISKGMPSPVIWSSGGRDFDKQAPVPSQVYYAVIRSWKHHLSGKPSEELGRLLLELLSESKTSRGQQHILQDLAKHWTPTAEEPLVELMNDKRRDFSLRRAAAHCLMLHKGADYHAVLLRFAKSSEGKEKKGWLDLLVDPRHKRVTGIDPEVVALGFDVLLEERKTNPGYVHGAYFIACDLGYYVGQEFKPDQRDEKYHGKHGLTETFFEETVVRALAWWEKNQPKYAGERLRAMRQNG